MPNYTDDTTLSDFWRDAVDPDKGGKIVCEYPSGSTVLFTETARKLTENFDRLVKQHANQAATIATYAKALDGLMGPAQQALIPGSGIDGARDAKNIRAVVSALLAQVRHQAAVISEYAEQAIEDGHD
jgi:hypothetical protein